MEFVDSIPDKPEEATLRDSHFYVTSAIYLLLVVTTQVVVKRFGYFAPLQPSPVSVGSRILLRLPVAAMAFVLLRHFQGQQPTDTSCLLFFALHCLDYCIDAFLTMLQFGRIRFSDHQGEPAYVVEWAGTLYFSPIKSLSHPDGPVVSLMMIDLLQVLLTNLMGVTGDLRRFRLIPTTLIGLVNIVHACYWCGFRNAELYPTVFYYMRIPDFLIVCLTAALSFCYCLAFLVLGDNMRYRFAMFDDVHLEDDFNMALRKLAIFLAVQISTTNESFGNELDPIFVPIVGLPPSLLVDVHVKPLGYNRNIDTEPSKKSTMWRGDASMHRKGSVADSLVTALETWVILLRFLVFPFKLCLSKAVFMFRKWPAALPNEPCDALDEDADYDPTSHESDENSDAESVMTQKDDEETSEDEETVFKELFWLANDLVTSQEASTLATNRKKPRPSPFAAIGPLINQAMNEPSVMTRRQRIRNGLPTIQSHDLVHQLSSSFQVTNASQMDTGNTFSSQACVVCHSESRNIVLRPCGCLCLCDSCRQSLAFRKYKECPCCRRFVNGYQKIFTP